MAAFAHLLSNPEENQRLRRNGRATAATYTWDEVLKTLIQRLQFLGLSQGWKGQGGNRDA